MIWTVVIIIIVISIIDYSLLIMSNNDIFDEDEDVGAPWEEEPDVEEKKSI